MDSIEGIILTAVPFEEKAHVISLFSKEHGRIKFVAKAQKRNDSHYSPLLRVEAVVTVSEKEFWKCRECSITSSYPQLRLSLACLQHAAKMAHLLTKFAPMHHPLPEIYLLFEQFLQELPLFSSSELAASLFLIKVCLQEGLLPSNLFSQEEMKRILGFASATPTSLYSEKEVPRLLEKLIAILI